MRHELADLGAFADAARVQRESLPFAENDRDRACGRALEDVDDWRETGLGRQYAEELFLLAGVAGGELGREVFAEADLRGREVAAPSPGGAAGRRRGGG